MSNSNTHHELPYSIVVHWSDKNVAVHCHYCRRIHHHGTGVDENTGLEFGQRRLAHCGTSSYRLLFPFEDEALSITPQISWELDKQSRDSKNNIYARFVTVGLDPSDIEDEDDEGTYIRLPSTRPIVRVAGDDTEGEDARSEASVTDSMGAMMVSQKPVEEAKKTGEGVWAELMQDPKHREALFFSYCVSNRVAELEDLLSNYANDNLIRKRNDEGDNGIALAAMQGHIRIVKLLCDRGGYVNNYSRRGRTPLMEAALWGRTEVVRFLLSNYANSNFKDLKGNRAVDLAAPCEKTKRERYIRNKGWRPFDESTVPDSQRRLIESELRRVTRVPATRRLGQGASGAAQNIRSSINPIGIFDTSNSRSRIIPYYSLQQVYQISNAPKAVGRLRRDGHSQDVSVMSGYTQGGLYADPYLNNAEWTRKALLLLESFGWTMPESRASHAEVQLLTYYIEKHVMWDPDEGVRRELFKLAPVRPPSVIQAEILVSKRAVCNSCKRFVEVVCDKFGILYRFEDGTRQSPKNSRVLIGE